MRIITKEVKVYSLSLKGLFKKVKAFVSIIGQKVKEFINKVVASEKIAGEKTKKFAKKIGNKLNEIIDIVIAYIHAKIDQFELWLYLKLEAKFADTETGLDTLRDELVE